MGTSSAQEEWFGPCVPTMNREMDTLRGRYTSWHFIVGKQSNVWFEVLTAVSMNYTGSWVLTPPSSETT
jgi:hypothetical protein